MRIRISRTRLKTDCEHFIVPVLYNKRERERKSILDAVGECGRTGVAL